MKKRFISYIRVSTKRQGESGLGMDSQRDYINLYMDRLDGEIVEEFVEVESGKTTDNRDILNEAIQACLRRRCTLVVAKADRLARNHTDTMAICKRLNDKVFCCDVPEENGKPNMLILAMMSWIAEKEREFISLRTKQALAQRRKRFGKRVPKKPIDDAARQKSIEQKKAKSEKYHGSRNMVALIESCLKDKLIIDDICTELNMAGYKPPRGDYFSPRQAKRVIAKVKQNLADKYKKTRGSRYAGSELNTLKTNEV